MGAKFLRLRLDVITSDGGRKFHKDVIKARLVCTYRGTGTQYGIGSEGQDPAPNAITTINGGSPNILRGKLWPESPDSGLLH